MALLQFTVGINDLVLRPNYWNRAATFPLDLLTLIKLNLSVWSSLLRLKIGPVAVHLNKAINILIPRQAESLLKVRGMLVFQIGRCSKEIAE